MFFMVLNFQISRIGSFFVVFDVVDNSDTKVISSRHVSVSEPARPVVRAPDADQKLSNSIAELERKYDARLRRIEERVRCSTFY